MTEVEYDRWLSVMNKWLSHKDKWQDKYYDGKHICNCTFNDWWPETPYDCDVSGKEPSSQ
jgi:hypothetical protein